MRIDATEGGGRTKFVPEISLGNLLLIGTMVVGIAGHFVEVGVTGNQTQRDVASLRTDMTSQIAEVKEQVTDLKKNLTPIIQLGVRVDEQDRKIADLYHRSDDTNGHLSEVNILAHGARSDLDNIIRASSLSLPGHR